MNLITLENIYKSYSEKVLLNNIKLNITDEDKIGIIGINGAGKSTLLKIIAGEEISDSGTIVKMNGLRISYLAQDISYNPEDTIMEAVFNGPSEIMSTLRHYEKALLQLQADAENEKLQREVLLLSSKIDALNGWQIESEAKAILTKLKINNFSMLMGNLSGGQRKRVALCNTLICPCDLLILDEPTNHMDNDLIDYLEELLRTRKNAVIMITHDRYFLDRITNKIFEVDNGNLYSYIGNYSTFLEKKMERVSLMESLERKRQNLYKKELAWIKRGAKARSTKQKARIQRFEDIRDNAIQINEAAVEISTGSSRLGKKILEIEDINKSYNNDLLIKNFSYIVTKEDRIGIIGSNGIGKSTLLNILSGKIRPDSGNVICGETVKLGYFTQENGEMNPNLRALEYIKEVAEFVTTSDGFKITASQMLERFLFEGAMQFTPISKLSGGEKRRLYLLRILMEAPNVLLMDEPTNDLDIETLTILEDYIDNFNGAIITISHDRYFLDRIVNKIFAFEGKGEIIQIVGNYSDYKDYKNDLASEIFTNEISKEGNSNKNSAAEKSKEKKDKPMKFTYKEQKEFDEIDNNIENKESELEEIKNKIGTAGSDFILLQELVAMEKKLQDELDFLMERWTYLNERYEEIEALKNGN
ncbi:ABC-F family ATP-binding cassette domain-containing protein [Clostridium sp.]|uniref:ABC-F family ATP-binding cassette domain-containing protein n=1 Tax=Clostridium sp. TaxID=1506 RepID=UPI002FCCB4B1